jgi:hypothetical protein
MATKKPRIQVSLKTSEYELVKRLAKLQGRSMSQVLSELFEEIAPVYERVAVVLQAASRAKVSAHEGMRQAAEQAEAEMAPHVAAAMGQFDLLAQHFGVGAAPAPASASGASGAGPAPPSTPAPVTRGSGLAQAHRTNGAPRPKSSARRVRKPKSLQGLASAIARQVRKGPKGKRA